MTDIPTELQPRVVALLRKMTGKGWDASNVDQMADRLAEARAIVALLPEPVNPDLLEAREIVAQCCSWFHHDAEQAASMAILIRRGEWDEVNALVPNALAVLKRGRQLERGEP